MVSGPHVALCAQLPNNEQHATLLARLKAVGISGEHMRLRTAAKADLSRFDAVVVVYTIGSHALIESVCTNATNQGRRWFRVDHRFSGWPIDMILDVPIVRTASAPSDAPPELEPPPTVPVKPHARFSEQLVQAMQANEIGVDALLDLMDLQGRLDRWTAWQDGTMTEREYSTLVELFPGLHYASGVVFEPVQVTMTEDVIRTVPVTSPVAPPEPEPSMPAPVDAISKQAVIRLASLSASARATLPAELRELLLTAHRLDFTLEDVLDLLAIKEPT